MNWKLFKEVLPNDGQRIVVYHEGLNKELLRVFYLDFWVKNNRSFNCDEFCKKWRPR